jgi:hypothetical protein
LSHAVVHGIHVDASSRCFVSLSATFHPSVLLPQVLASQVADRAAKEQLEKQEELEYAAHEQVRRTDATG